MNKPIEEQIIDIFKSYRLKRLKQLKQSDEEMPENSMLAEARAIYDLVAHDIHAGHPSSVPPPS